MARKTAAEAARTRKKILDAAGDLFSREGVANTTLEQVAQQASVTRGAIYWHFKGKEDLLRTLFGEQTLPLENSLPEGIDFSSGWQRLHGDLVETVCGEMPRRLSEIMMYQGACGADPATHQRRLARVRESCMHRLQTLLENAVSKEELPSALDIQGALDFFRFCITGLLYECLQDSSDPVDAITSALAVLLHVVKVPPQHFLLKKSV
ncbi:MULTISPECIES: TetR family transcriptional regulator [Pseudomonas]|jgi:TetR/AcrR family acrAB operon transcriptional repressor|uniref:TetR family transcriptional regulator n=1 Tax=Pseudomonas TaxID=286 RepID=UPI000C2B0636|nr:MULTISPECIES: TetR family transcriptional regulator [Pseudomonas]PJX11583.1 TetR family transcriptional regulator [Pseudomonas putida]